MHPEVQRVGTVALHLCPLNPYDFCTDRQICATTMAHNASYPQPLTYLDDPINPNPDTLVVDYSTLWPSKDPFSPPDNHPSPESFIPQAYQNYGGPVFDEGESAISQAQGQNRSTMPFHSVEANGPLDEPNQNSSSEHSISYSFASQYGADLFAHFPHDLVRVDTFRAFSTDNCG
jgi:hypothetical protein